MCIANICTERSFINNFYDLVQMSLGQKGPWVAGFPAARFIPNQHNQDLLLSFWSNARLTLKLCIFRLALILVLFSFSNEWGIKKLDKLNVKNIYHVNWFGQIN